MKNRKKYNKKKYLKIILYIVLFFILVFIIDYGTINIDYLINKKDYEKSFLVQGINDKLVPQGLTYSSKYNVVLQSSYSDDGKNSILFVINYDNGELIKSLKLMNETGYFIDSHSGGLTTDNDKVYITSNYRLEEYSLEDIMKTNDNYIKAISSSELNNRGDFCLYHDNYLWIGEFHFRYYDSIPGGKPLLFGYDMTNFNNYDIPNYVIALPNMVQGMDILPDGSFVFSRSFSYLIFSHINIYKNVIEEDTDNSYQVKGTKVPYYEFNKNNKIKEIKIPPMAEGMFYKDNYLYIMFESGSSKYWKAIPKIRNIIKYKID